MANKTTKTKTTTTLVSACEQYVVEELKQAKEELAKTLGNVGRLRLENEALFNKHQELLNKVVKGLKAITFDTTGNTFDCLKIDDMFALSYYKQRERNSQRLNDFLDLIEYVKSIPTRE